MMKENTILFEEKQRLLANPVIWVSMFFSVGMVVFLNITTGDVSELWPTLLIIAVVNIILVMVSLRTRIYKEGIGITFFPFVPKERMYRYNTLQSLRVRKYNPLREYGGWGFKGKASNRAFNISGDMGLQLEMNDGRRVLIGTKRPEDIEQVLHRLDIEHIFKNEIPVREDRF